MAMTLPGTTYRVRGETRSAELDGIRGVAIVMVLLTHLFVPLPESAVSAVLQRVFGSFWLGVDLFFVLSGYLITGILLQAKGSDGYYRRFYLRRTLRIFPAYYVFILFVFLVLPILHPRIGAASEDGYGWYFLFYLQNWWMASTGERFPVWGVNHLWSVAIEEQFYLVWPLVVACLNRSALRYACFALITLSILGKLLLLEAGAGWMTIWTATLCRMEGLAAGAWVSTLDRTETTRWRFPISTLGLACGAALVLMMVLGIHTEDAPLRTTIGIATGSGFFAWLLYLIHADRFPGPLLTTLRNPVLTWFGRYSYGLYLVHYALILSPTSRLLGSLYPGITELSHNAQLFIRGGVSLSLTLVAALVLFHSVEKRLLALRSHFRREQPTATPTEARGYP